MHYVINDTNPLFINVLCIAVSFIFYNVFFIMPYFFSSPLSLPIDLAFISRLSEAAVARGPPNNIRKCVFMCCADVCMPKTTGILQVLGPVSYLPLLSLHPDCMASPIPTVPQWCCSRELLCINGSRLKWVFKVSVNIFKWHVFINMYANQCHMFRWDGLYRPQTLCGTTSF